MIVPITGERKRNRVGCRISRWIILILAQSALESPQPRCDWAQEVAADAGITEVSLPAWCSTTPHLSSTQAHQSTAECR
ncbi:hypothetical protein VZT92_017588 [Zoarces viviparus]|uniref:Secreted protein n=1 Tax=Zoarces viviparus TaxID=48416 RepID=A0AAW1EMB3_ZOAVI